MKKIISFLSIFFVVVLLLSGCSDGSETTAEEEQATKTEVNKQEATKEDAKKEEDKKENSFNKTIELDNELVFAEYTVKMNEVKVYEKDGSAFADISFNWINQAGDGAKMFFQVSTFDVVQGENILEEVSGAWDIENKNSSDIYFPNAQNGEHKVELTYELANKEEPLTIKIRPMTGEDTEEITVEIN